MTRIVTYARRPKRAPRKKPGKAITVSAIAKAPTKGERIRRREAADSGREVSPEEAVRAEAFLACMMRPPGE